ncbi:MAG: hypothetical protein HKN87_18435 [Saprospiraceae bacterium]|nr:hypothetical protein [Saprospiraceae bacterium]
MIRWILASLMLLLISGCKKDEQAIVPSFVSIPEVGVEVSANQGTSRHGISEVWVYADSSLLGAFAVGATFPVIASEAFTLDLFAGIRENGQALAPRTYPFLNPVQVNLLPKIGETQTLRPSFTYHPRTTFKLNEDFERSQIFDEDLDQDEATFLFIREDGIEGRSASAVLTPEHPTLEVASNQILRDIPTTGQSTYLEMEYRSDVPLQVGLRGHGPGIGPAKNYKLVLFPTDIATKIYVNFSPDLQASQLLGYQVIFLATFEVDFGILEQRIDLDNIKLLHF